MHILADVHKWQDMDGSTPTERRLNAYLTATFVMRHGIPSDECLGEALHILNLDTRASTEYRIGTAAKYLETQFGELLDGDGYHTVAERALALAAGKAVWP